MNLGLFFAALRSRIRLFGLVLGATLMATLLVSLLVPKTYRATASVVVDTEQEQSLNNALAPVRDRISYIQTQADILASERVARKVVYELRLADDPEARAAFEAKTDGRGRIEDWLVAGLLQKLEVDSSQSNVIRVSFSSPSARTAAATANGFAGAFVTTVLDLRVEPMRTAATWFDEQLKTLRANLEQAQKRLADYHRQHGIVSADERNDVEFTRMGELSSQLAHTQDQSLDLETRARQAREFLARGGSPEQLPDVQSNPQVQALQIEIRQG
ncbi:MAG: Wzz/FepE/Etk N-terminal domain-containing protein, partial [Steroidobacteraceae bacterium]